MRLDEEALKRAAETLCTANDEGRTLDEQHETRLVVTAYLEAAGFREAMFWRQADGKLWPGGPNEPTHRQLHGPMEPIP